MRDHRDEFRLSTMCRVLKVERSGFYAWLKQPQSMRAREDERLLVMIEEAYLASGGVYGARNVHRDLTEEVPTLGLRAPLTPRTAERQQPLDHGICVIRSAGPEIGLAQVGQPLGLSASVDAPGTLHRLFEEREGLG